jgi:hypothetical protein
MDRKYLKKQRSIEEATARSVSLRTRIVRDFGQDYLSVIFDGVDEALPPIRLEDKGQKEY